MSSLDQDDKSLRIFNLRFLLDTVDLKYRTKTYDMALYFIYRHQLSTVLRAEVYLYCPLEEMEQGT